jgi:folate-binding protein YgfZ
MPALTLAAWHTAHGAQQFAPETADSVPHYQDTETEYRFIQTAAGLFDASGRDRLFISGNDRLDFIQGLATNDVEKLEVGRSVELAFVTAKGKLVADARVTKLEDALLFDLEAGRAAALDELWAKFHLHEQIEWADVSEALVTLELWGPKAAEVLGEAHFEEGNSRAVTVADATFAAIGTAFGVLLYVPADSAEAVADELFRRLSSMGGGLVGRAAVEAARVELGLGRYGIDWDENTNPLEAGMDRLLDYKKGCYVGQEVVAKATYIGHVNRRLVRLEWEGDVVEANTPLIGGRSPGRVTTSARVPGTNRVVALGYVRRDSAAAGTKHRVGENGPEATVLGYPYRSKEKPV